MIAFKTDVSVQFNAGVSNYLNDIDNNALNVEDTFQETLNGGFKNIYFTTMSAAIAGFLVLQMYSSKPSIEDILLK